MNEFLRYYAKNNFATTRYIQRISGLYKLSEDELYSLYEAEFLKLFRRSIKHSPFYRKLYLQKSIGLNDVRRLEDIQKLPILTKEDIKAHSNEIHNGLSHISVKGFTSGTTGTPLTLFRNPLNIAKEQAYIRYYRSQMGYKIGQPLLSIRGTLGKATPYEYFKKANILYISSPNINSSTIEMYYQMVKDFAPVAVEAYPSYLHKFCLELRHKGLELQIPNAFTSSETLMVYQREMVEPFLKTVIHDWYGNAERSILLAQNKEQRYEPLPLYSINEFHEDHVVTTNLINTRFPLIRYVVDDVIEVASQDFRTNILKPDILSIKGRASDNVILKDGSWVGCMDHAFKGVPNIEMAQIHQYDVLQPIEIKLVVNTSYTKNNEEQLQANLVRMLGTATPFFFTYCDKSALTYTANEKFSLIIKKKTEIQPSLS